MEYVMEYKIPKDDIVPLLMKQLSVFAPYPDTYQEVDVALIKDAVGAILPRVENCFSHSENKYFCRVVDGQKIVRFDPYHSVQWMIFLYYLSHELYLRKSPFCDKVYYLNKIMNGVDLFYAIELPDVWGAEHPVGSVMGRATYGNGFFFFHGCTVGTVRDREGNYVSPMLEENVHMFANSTILGKCHIGKNVQIGAGAMVKNEDIPDNSLVFGCSPNLIIKQRVTNW